MYYRVSFSYFTLLNTSFLGMDTIDIFEIYSLIIALKLNNLGLNLCLNIIVTAF